MEVVQKLAFIGINPSVRSGRPYLIGTTLTVADVVVAKIYQQLSPDDIADQFGLTLAQVYAALAYYYDNKQAIDDSITERRLLAERMKEKRVGSRHPPLLR